MKRLFIDLALLFVVLWCLVLMSGCVTPDEDYVRADAAAWKHYDQDQRLERWIIMAVDKGELTAQEADALRKLNVGRRARITRAIATFDEGDSK